MANELDEMTGPVNGAGRDVNVIEKQLPVRVGFGSLLFEIILWCLGILPGVIFLFMKISADNYFRQLQQKIQSDASQIDNFLEQRVQIDQVVRETEIFLGDLELCHELCLRHLSEQRAERLARLEVNRTVLDLDQHVVTEFSVQWLELF